MTACRSARELSKCLVASEGADVRPSLRDHRLKSWIDSILSLIQPLRSLRRFFVAFGHLDQLEALLFLGLFEIL